jgi:hypothetical protein
LLILTSLPFYMLTTHSLQVTSNPQTSDPTNSYRSTTLLCTKKIFAIASSPMRPAISSLNGQLLIRLTASLAAGLSVRPTPTGLTASLIHGAHCHQRARSLLRQRSTCLRNCQSVELSKTSEVYLDMSFLMRNIAMTSELRE